MTGAAPACRNCGTELLGAWCHACGQHGHGHHRSLRHLAAEFLETMTHADGRLWHTLRLLALHPARLTGDYLVGRRASEIPPLRLFLVVLFVLFALAAPVGGFRHVRIDGRLEPEISSLRGEIAHLSLGSHADAARWLRPRLLRAVDEPSEFFGVIGEWSERFALLMLPVAAAIMWLLAIGRGFTLFDHLVFAMHSLSATGSILILDNLLSRIGMASAGDLLMLAPPVHLFLHMKGLYGFGTAGTLLRMAALLAGSCIAMVCLMAGLAAFGLLELGN